MKSDQEITNSIRAAIDDCTRGIEETPSLQYHIARKARGEEPVKKRASFSVVIIIAMLLIGTMTALAAGMEGINAMLYNIWPEAARALRPLNLSDEEAGIRLDVISASLTDNQLLITYSLTDLKGDRLSKETECDPTVEYPLGELEGQVTTENQMISFDPKKHQAVFAAHTEYESILSPDVVRFGHYLDKVTFTVKGLRSPVIIVKDLWPMMANQDYLTEAVSCPERPNGLSTIAAERVQANNISDIPDILNPTNNLHIPISDNIELSGIGWIDGDMHVQIHVSNQLASVTDEYGSSLMEKYSVYTYLVDQQGNDVPWYDAIFNHLIPDTPYFISSIYWFEDNDQWIEYIFPIRQEEMDQYMIICELTDQMGKNEELLNCEWIVSFPTNMIRTEGEFKYD